MEEMVVVIHGRRVSDFRHLEPASGDFLRQLQVVGGVFGKGEFGLLHAVHHILHHIVVLDDRRYTLHLVIRQVAVHVGGKLLNAHGEVGSVEIEVEIVVNHIRSSFL